MYIANVTIHLYAAFVWLGGMFFFALVGVPVLRKIEPPDLRARLFSGLGRRARNVGWIALAVLVVTGIINMHFRSVLSLELLMDPAFRATRYGTALGWKLAAVAAMLVVSAFHDFLFGPAASRLVPGSGEANRARRIASWLGRINALLGVILVIAATRLARGG
jgi:uncharacterized membrane protein